RVSLHWSCVLTLLTGTLDIDDTARAQFRVPRVAADVAAQVPAAHAFGLAAGFDLDPDARFAGWNRRIGRRIGLDDVRLAGDQQKPQFVAQRREAPGLPRRRIHRHFRLERRADIPRRAQPLEVPR